MSQPVAMLRSQYRELKSNAEVGTRIGYTIGLVGILDVTLVLPAMKPIWLKILGWMTAAGLFGTAYIALLPLGAFARRRSELLSRASASREGLAKILKLKRENSTEGRKRARALGLLEKRYVRRVAGILLVMLVLAVLLIFGAVTGYGRLPEAVVVPAVVWTLLCCAAVLWQYTDRKITMTNYLLLPEGNRFWLEPDMKICEEGMEEAT